MGIGLRGYGQKDPLVEYKNEGFEMFDRLMASIDDEIVHRIYKIQIQQSPPEAEQHQHVVAPSVRSNTALVSTSNNSQDTKSATTSDKKSLVVTIPVGVEAEKNTRSVIIPTNISLCFRLNQTP
ncbi:hypothetical protein M1349_04485 [Patescibacteria group bacterium]|nr:hypothetical protein [Patescibacteria group bacterium]